MNRAVIVVIAILAVLAGFVLLMLTSMVRSGFSTHDDPGAMETMMARRMRAWAVPSDLRDAKNPVAPTPAILAEARAHFADHCATCHGNDGKGSDLGRRMYPKAPDMTLPQTQTMSDGALFGVIENGIRLSGMPGFGTGTAESAYGSWSLVHFIRHLPKLTPQELDEMARLNPKSPAEWRSMQPRSPAKESSTAAPPPHGASGHHH